MPSTSRPGDALAWLNEQEARRALIAALRILTGLEGLGINDDDELVVREARVREWLKSRGVLAWFADERSAHSFIADFAYALAFSDLAYASPAPLSGDGTRSAMLDREVALAELGLEDEGLVPRADEGRAEFMERAGRLWDAFSDGLRSKGLGPLPPAVRRPDHAPVATALMRRILFDEGPHVNSEQWKDSADRKAQDRLMRRLGMRAPGGQTTGL